MEKMIRIKKVSKVFHHQGEKRSLVSHLFPKAERLVAVNDVTLKIEKGEIYGLLGPNGAGKTTLIKMISGLLKPTSGEIRVNGSNVYGAQKDIGLMLGDSMVYNLMTGYDNLDYAACLYGVSNPRERIKEMAGFLEIGDWIHRHVSEYSLGMRVKLCLARALIHDPLVLLLDEPTLGLDPHYSVHIRNIIKALGKTVILTTHYMEEADFLSDRVGILHHGRLIAEGRPEILKHQIEKQGSPSLTDVFIHLTKEA